MRDHWRRLSLRDMSRFVGVVAIVAVVGVMIGREAGIGRQTGASVAPAPADESPPLPKQPSEETTALTLTLSAPELCETERGEGFAGQEWVYDDEGEIVGTRSVGTGWANVAEIPVHWEVRGGAGPYTLVIDNESRDGFGPYEGPNGTASVSCAPKPGEVFYKDYDQERRYRSDPQLDSGPKEIHVTVTDAKGTKVSASTTIYTILRIHGSIRHDGARVQLAPGKTYRVLGTLFTIPEGMTIEMGSIWEADGGSGLALQIQGRDAVLYISPYTGEELYRAYGSTKVTIVWPGPVPEGLDGGVDAVQDGDNLDLDPDALIDHGHLDSFVATRGKLPNLSNAP